MCIRDRSKTMEEKIPLKIQNVGDAFSNCKSKMIEKTISNGGVMLAVKLPYLGGKLGSKTLDSDGAQLPRLGRELASAAKLAGVAGIFHSDELPAYGITEIEVNSVKEFLDLMHIYKLDYTNTFLDLENNTLNKKIFKNWEEKYKNNKLRKFKNVNPQIIPRNHIIEEIINEVYSNNYSQLYEFEKLLKNPYEKIENKKYIKPPLESEKVFETFCGT